MRLFSRIYIIIRCVIGVIFIYAGLTKLFDPRVFAALIDAYGILPDVFVMPAAFGLPLLEIAAGAGLVFDIRGSLTTITVMLIIFIAAMGYGISMGLDIDCGCFGPGDTEVKAYHGLRTTLYRDIILLAGVLYLYSWRRIKDIKPRPFPFDKKNLFKRRIKNAI